MAHAVQTWHDVLANTLHNQGDNILRGPNKLTNLMVIKIKNLTKRVLPLVTRITTFPKKFLSDHKNHKLSKKVFTVQKQSQPSQRSSKTTHIPPKDFPSNPLVTTITPFPT